MAMYLQRGVPKDEDGRAIQSAGPLGELGECPRRRERTAKRFCRVCNAKLSRYNGSNDLCHAHQFMGAKEKDRQRRAEARARRRR